MLRDLLAKLVAPVLKITGYRFTKYHRKNDTLLFKVLNTTRANQIADGY